MRKRKTLFDYVDPRVYRFVHMCRACNQPNFRTDADSRHACAVCGEFGNFDVLPFYNPEQDYALDADHYALTMMYALWKRGLHQTPVVVDEFFRKAPFVRPSGDYTGELGGYVAFGGLGHLVEIIENLYFNEDDIAYIREEMAEDFDPAFLDDLRRLRFTGDLYAVKEGNIIYPNTPFITIVAPAWECIWLEAQMLQTVNSESLFLTKASRILTAAGDGAVILEMGKRRGQGRDATVNGAKMAYIAGFSATSNLKAGKKFALPTTGTFAHFYVQFHPDELDAFLHFAEVFPHKTIPVLDTADTLLSGLPNAIRTAKFLEEKGFRMIGVRLDSGDLAYLSKAVRESLDREGLNYVKIAATNDLDEYTITSLKAQGAKIDIWGVGTKFITAFDSPALGGVHKIVARKPFAHEKSDASLAEDWIPLIKISDSLEKVLNPGLKKVYRIYDQHGMAKGDYIALSDENIAGQKEIVLRHPTNPLKTKVVKNFRYEELLHPVFIGGKRTAELPGLDELREYHKRQKATMWEEYLRLDVPEVYPVALSEKLRELKEQLVYKMRGKLRG